MKVHSLEKSNTSTAWEARKCHPSAKSELKAETVQNIRSIRVFNRIIPNIRYLQF